MNYFCNPINMAYKYQFSKSQGDAASLYREAADPSMITYKGRYYIFPSMTCGFIYSDDLANWKFHPLKNTPNYDYAPDVCVVGDYVYFCASNRENCSFYRTKDLFSEEFEKFESAFTFWDPALFQDDDGRLYFYWNIGPASPIYGVELDIHTMQPLCERKELIFCCEEEKGFERRGENHRSTKPTPEEIEAKMNELGIPAEARESLKRYFSGLPNNEGAWMTKNDEKYYLQYATPGTQFNIYCDAVYVSDSPLGNYIMAKNNPFSYKPGGFIPGAGHGSTEKDIIGRYWHASTMRISINHKLERRIGLWRAGFDKDGDLFCDQRYGDFPFRVDKEPWEKPDFMLLSFGKIATASSFEGGKTPDKAIDENVQTWWRARTNTSGEWLEVDLEEEYDIRAIQINFADDGLVLPLPESAVWIGVTSLERWIDEVHQPTRWLLEGSADGKDYFIIEDKSEADTDLPHDFILRENGIKARYVKLTVISLPYAQVPCVSGLRVFGIGHGAAPLSATGVLVEKEGELDINVSWEGSAIGYNVLWGFAPEKLYHSYMVFDKKVRIGGIVKGLPVYLRVDSFNESGITEGQIINCFN